MQKKQKELSNGKVLVRNSTALDRPDYSFANEAMRTRLSRRKTADGRTAKRAESGNDRKSNLSPRPLERLLTTLEYVVAADGRVSLPELEKVANVPKATAYRLLGTLVSAKLLKTGENDRYEVGQRLLRLMQMLRDPEPIAMLVSPVLDKLVQATNETSYLTQLIGTRVVVVQAQAPEGRNYVFHVNVGREMPFHAAATAKVLFANQPKHICGLVAKKPMERMTTRTIHTRKRLLEEYERVRQQGWAICAGEMHDGIGALAVPVDVPVLGVTFAVGLTGALEGLVTNQQLLLSSLREASVELAPILGISSPKGNGRRSLR